MTAKFPEVILCYLPPNLTGKLQPLDVAINSNFKQQIKTIFGMYAAEQSVHETFFLDGMTKERKRLAIDWIHQGWSAVKEETVVKAWKKSGLLEAWNIDVINEAMDLFEQGKLFPRKQADVRGFELQPVPIRFDAALGQHENKSGNDQENSPMEYDSFDTLTDEDEEGYEISLMDTSDPESLTTSDALNGLFGGSEMEGQSATGTPH